MKYGKRKYDSSSAPMMITKRLRRVERQAYINRGEMKTQTTNISGLVGSGSLSIAKPCLIGTGGDIDQRVGNKIRVWRIECRGTADSRVDLFILQKKQTDDPVITDFTTVKGCYLTDSVNTTKFTEWRHYRNQEIGATGDGTVKFSHSFRNGMVVRYSGPNTTNLADNELQVVAVNRHTASASVTVNVRIWYTDN